MYRYRRMLVYHAAGVDVYVSVGHGWGSFAFCDVAPTLGVFGSAFDAVSPYGRRPGRFARVVLDVGVGGAAARYGRQVRL